MWLIIGKKGGRNMAFTIGLIIGSAATFMITCIIASKKISEAYLEGYRTGKEKHAEVETDDRN